MKFFVFRKPAGSALDSHDLPSFPGGILGTKNRTIPECGPTAKSESCRSSAPRPRSAGIDFSAGDSCLFQACVDRYGQSHARHKSHPYLSSRRASIGRDRTTIDPAGFEMVRGECRCANLFRSWPENDRRAAWAARSYRGRRSHLALIISTETNRSWGGHSAAWVWGENGIGGKRSGRIACGRRGGSIGR